MYNLELLLGIIGVLILLAVAINAFFLKGIYAELYSLKISFSTVIAEQVHAKDKREQNAKDIVWIKREIQMLRDRCNTLESNQNSTINEIGKLLKEERGH